MMVGGSDGAVARLAPVFDVLAPTEGGATWAKAARATT